MLRNLVAFICAILVSAAGWGANAGSPEDAPHLPGDYWAFPLVPQGPAPDGWGDVESSLDPEDCGTCHGDKLEEWRTSLHAKALSPGLVGQLLSYSADETQTCLNCHAPLAEQAAAFEMARNEGPAHLAAAVGLAAAGNSCGGCHVRARRFFGPPQSGSGAVGAGSSDMPHGGVFRTADFESSEFCDACHQFDQSTAINGNPLQNTVEEWRRSPQAAAGETCQSCHMPDRRHLWRGIHDPEMVSAGVTPAFEIDPEGIRFILTNTGVGHAFPTYVTPKVELRGVALDALGLPLPGTEAVHVIQRRVVFEGGDWVEKRDTRLLPGESAVLSVSWGDGEKIRLWLEVHPDDFYDHDVYDGLLESLPEGSHGAALISEADRQAKANRFTLFENEIKRPGNDR